MAIILGILIWSAQSKGAILYYFATLFVSLPIISFNTSKQFYENSHINKKNLILETDRKPLTDNRFKVLKYNDSGRTDLWISSFKLYNKSKIFGYGPQGDRFLLPMETTDGYGNSVSNRFMPFYLGGMLDFYFFQF